MKVTFISKAVVVQCRSPNSVRQFLVAVQVNPILTGKHFK